MTTTLKQRYQWGSSLLSTIGEETTSTSGGDSASRTNDNSGGSGSSHTPFCGLNNINNNRQRANKSTAATTVTVRIRRTTTTSSTTNHNEDDEKDSYDSLSIPTCQLLQREREMRETAERFQISLDRWQGSRLYNAFQKKRKKESTANIIITLDPEQDCRQANLCHQLVWKPWLTKMLQQFYATRQVEVQPASVGYDVLIVLEYFGILYQPDQLVFGDLKVYRRVKQWSQYLTQRSILADLVAERVMRRNVNDFYLFFTTSATAGEEQQECTIGRHRVLRLPLVIQNNELDDNNNLVEQQQDSPRRKNNRRLIHHLFHDSDQAPAMRDDFCLYLDSVLHVQQVSFPIKVVTVLRGDTMKKVPRAVLTIHLFRSSTTESPNKRSPKRFTTTAAATSYPMDEAVQEEMQKGKLEKLLQQVQQRNNNNPNSRSPRQVTDFDRQQATLQPRRRVRLLSTKKNLLDKEQVRDSNKNNNVRGKLQGGAVVQQAQPSPSRVATAATQDRYDMMITDEEACAAPVKVIRARSGEQSVTSALTGPYFYDQDGNLRDVFEENYRNDNDEDTRAQALRYEWIQSSFLNRDISARVRELLLQEKDESSDADSIILVEAAKTTNDQARTPVGQQDSPSWDWFTGMWNAPALSLEACTTNFTGLLFQNHHNHQPQGLEGTAAPSPSSPCVPTQLMPAAPCPVKQPVARVAEKMTTAATAARTERRTTNPAATPARGKSPARVKDRMILAKRAVEKHNQSRHDSLFGRGRTSNRQGAAAVVSNKKKNGGVVVAQASPRRRGRSAASKSTTKNSKSSESTLSTLKSTQTTTIRLGTKVSKDEKSRKNTGLRRIICRKQTAEV